jgi:transcriptional regulator with XRE-family HTH domain
MTTQNGRAFNEWLRAQLKAKKMSQRQLAQQSGVDHSTISRLIRGDRMPSLGTATKLARGLRELRDDADTPQYLGLVAAGAANPTARVEYALRADELLTEAQVRQIMEYYLAVRMRRFGRAFQPPDSGDHPGEHGQANPGQRGRGPVTHGQAYNGGSTAMTPRLGTAGAMTGTIRPMAATVRPLTTVRSMSNARPMTQAPRPMGRASGRDPGRDSGRY